MSAVTIVMLVGAFLVIAVAARFLTKPFQYPATDLDAVDRDALLVRMEKMLEASEAWPANLTDGKVVLATSLEPFAVRTVRYEVEADVDFEAAVAYVKNLSDCGETSRKSEDKFEETLYDKNRGGEGHAWVRRSVHISPPPGSNRDAVVVYFEDRPDPKTYRIGFRSVDSIEGRAIAPYEGASRFMVNPAIYKVEETAPGRVRIRKLEAVDPQGAVSPLLNNYFISLLFFRKYMFEEAKAMRDSLVATGR